MLVFVVDEKSGESEEEEGRRKKEVVVSCFCFVFPTFVSLVRPNNE